MGQFCSKKPKTKQVMQPHAQPQCPRNASPAESPHAVPNGFEASHQAVRLLGRGAAADTWLFQDRKRRQLVAIKLFPRPIPQDMAPSVLREIQTQSELSPGCINLINVYEAVLTPHHLGLVMEWAAGGSLTTAVAEAWTKGKPGGLVMDEDEARFLFRQFIEAVDYCHRHYIAHRDLKLDNTLLDGHKPATIKICDFGFARHFQPHFERAVSHLGTPEYMGPEILHNMHKGRDQPPEEYNVRAVDVWAAGVMLVVALLGAFPFDHTRQHVEATDSEVDLWIQEVTQSWAESHFIASNVKALSPEARDLLDKIFVVDPRQRITVQGIMGHPWYTKALTERYQDAMDRLHEEQRHVDAHLAHRKLDQVKVEARNAALAKMVEAASSESAMHASKSYRHLRPLHVLDLRKGGGGGATRHIDLTEIAVLQEGCCDCSAHDMTVAERSGSVGNLQALLHNGSNSRLRPGSASDMPASGLTPGSSPTMTAGAVVDGGEPLASPSPVPTANGHPGRSLLAGAPIPTPVEG